MESDFIKHWDRALLPISLCPSQAYTSCPSLCFLLNSFCAETQRTWASVSPGSRYWNPHQVGDTKPAAHQHVEPRAVGARRFMMLTATYLTTSQRRVHKLTTPILSHYYKTLWAITIKLLTTPSCLRHTVLRALAHCGPFAWQSNKAILFYFIQKDGEKKKQRITECLFLKFLAFWLGKAHLCSC